MVISNCTNDNDTFFFFPLSVDKIATKLSDTLTAAMDFSFADS